MDSFRDPFASFRDLRSLTAIAMLTAVNLLLSLTVSIQISQSLKLSFGFLATALIAHLYGPVPAMISAGICDILQALIRPTGPYFPGFTLTAVLGALIYGLFLYRQKPTWLSVGLARGLVNLLLHVLLNSLWLKLLYGSAFWAMLPTRLFKNLALLPLEILLLMLILPLGEKFKQWGKS